MSARKFARDTPRSVQSAVRAALTIIVDAIGALPPPDDDTEVTKAMRERLEAGEVIGGMVALQIELGHDSASATRAVVQRAEAWNLLRRVGHAGSQTGARRLFVVGSRLKTGTACANCSRPTTKTHCRNCQPAFRRDRAWRILALEMAVDGKSPMEIAVAVGQPVYPQAGDGPLVGVVAYLLGEVPSLVEDKWRDGYHDVVGDDSRHRGTLTARARVRRHRREKAA